MLDTMTKNENWATLLLNSKHARHSTLYPLLSGEEKSSSPGTVQESSSDGSVLKGSLSSSGKVLRDALFILIEFCRWCFQEKD